MPEMPEVRTVSKDMNTIVKQKTIKKVQVFTPKIVKEVAPIEFESFLTGETFISVTNIGKWIVAKLTNKKVFLSHLRMTGRYNFYDSPNKGTEHTHLIFTFTDNTQLHFDDPRRFATAHIRTNDTLLTTNPIKKLGPEPGVGDVDGFYKKIHKSRRAIKTLVLDQSIILGYGNIYVDETLWFNGIHPERPGNSITKIEAKKILEVGAKIMDKSTKLGGSSISTYGSVNGKPGRYAEYLQIFRKDGKPCPNCQSIIKKSRVGGRGTHFCPKCQTL